MKKIIGIASPDYWEALAFKVVGQKEENFWRVINNCYDLIWSKKVLGKK